jgi:hypothetical protein
MFFKLVALSTACWCLVAGKSVPKVEEDADGDESPLKGTVTTFPSKNQR